MKTSNNLPDLDHTSIQTRHMKDANFTQMGPMGPKPDAYVSTTSKLFEIFYNPLFVLSERFETYNIKHRSCVVSRLLRCRIMNLVNCNIAYS